MKKSIEYILKGYAKETGGGGIYDKISPEKQLHVLRIVEAVTDVE